MGIDLHLKPMIVVPPIDRVVAAQLVKYPEMPMDVGLVYTDPAALAANDIRKACRKVVGMTMWEYESYRDLHTKRGIDVPPLTARLKDFDLLLATDDTSMVALKPHADAAGIPIKKLAGGFRSKLWKPVGRDWTEEPFRFGMLGRLDRRKGPWIAIGAFVKLKAEYGDEFRAELHMKTTLPGLEHVPHPDIHVHIAWWPYERVREFYGSLHCLLAPSTGEGKNVPALEAMATGCPVIATDYGGHREWLMDEYAFRLSAAPYEFEQGPAVKPVVDDLAKLMLEVYRERAKLRRMGEVASTVIPAMADWEKVVHRFLALEELR
jgi:glycosyltransferase involved in cell wall biosynthesis